MIIIGLCFLVTAFATRAIGTKVLHPNRFYEALADLIRQHDHSGDHVPGQMYVPCSGMCELVSGGVGPASKNPDDYVLREWRGDVLPFLRRELASPVKSLACIVYTREAYLADPEIGPDDPVHQHPEWTHLLVAVLAGSSPPSAHRLVANLAGGNKEALSWSAEEIRAKAQETALYYATHSIVAD